MPAVLNECAVATVRITKDDGSAPVPALLDAVTVTLVVWSSARVAGEACTMRELDDTSKCRKLVRQLLPSRVQGAVLATFTPDPSSRFYAVFVEVSFMLCVRLPSALAPLAS